jgi:selenophosphate synthase
MLLSCCLGSVGHIVSMCDLCNTAARIHAEKVMWLLLNRHAAAGQLVPYATEVEHLTTWIA